MSLAGGSGGSSPLLTEAGVQEASPNLATRPLPNQLQVLHLSVLYVYTSLHLSVKKEGQMMEPINTHTHKITQSWVELPLKEQAPM